MQILIDIPESIIEHIKDGSFGVRIDDRYALVSAVIEGAALSKHCRLIDADVCKNKNLCNSCITKECIFQSGIVRNHCDFYREN